MIRILFLTLKQNRNGSINLNNNMKHFYCQFVGIVKKAHFIQFSNSSTPNHPSTQLYFISHFMMILKSASFQPPWVSTLIAPCCFTWWKVYNCGDVCVCVWTGSVGSASNHWTDFKNVLGLTILPSTSYLSLSLSLSFLLSLFLSLSITLLSLSLYLFLSILYFSLSVPKVSKVEENITLSVVLFECRFFMVLGLSLNAKIFYILFCILTII